MIAFISGTVKATRGDALIVMTGGLGYLVHCTQNLLRSTETGSHVDLFVETRVSESDFVLFGFPQDKDLELFQKLCTVQGIAGKTALNAIGHLGYDGLCEAILTEDEKAISGTKGVGPKTAKKVIVDLKKYVEGEFGAGSDFTLDRGTAEIARAALAKMGLQPNQTNALIKEAVTTHGASIKATDLISACLQIHSTAN
jgi:holliday junction DNA helicase RuvA